MSSASTVIRHLLFVVASGPLLIGSSAFSNEEDQATLARYAPHGPHRFDWSYTHIDTVVGNVDALLLARRALEGLS